MEEFNRDNILEIIDRYYKQYNLPEMGITNGEWDSLLDNLKVCLTENNHKEIEAATNMIIRKAMNLAMLDNCDVITLYYIINALDDLKAFSISEETIHDLKYKIVMDGLKNNTKKEKTNTK